MSATSTLMTLGLSLVLSAAVPAQSVLHSVDGPASFDHLGTHVRPCGGDLDADGVDDWMARTSGTLFVISGADRSVIRALGPVWNVAGESIAAVRDLDGDQVPDLAIGYPPGAVVTVYSGATGVALLTISSPNPTLNNFGFAVAAGGDVNGDGTPDVLVGHLSSVVGTLSRGYVFSGVNGALLRTVTGTVPFDGFGHAVAGLGDLDGDGCDDFAVGAATSAGLTVFSGATGGVLLAVPGPGLAQRIRRFDDIDGDGKDDILVAAATGPRVLSSATGMVLIDLPLVLPTPFVYPADVDVLGDQDGDGIAEVLVSGYQPDVGGAPATIPGFVRVHSGATGALLFAVEGTTPTERFGFSCSRAGDSDGDGRDDVLVGAPEHDGAGPDAGRVFVLYRGRYPGSGEDLTLFSGENGVAVLGPDAIQVATPTVLTLRIATGGTFDFHPFALVADPFLAASPPPSNPVFGYPEVHVRPAAAFVLFDSLANPGPIGPIVLMPGGLALSYAVPPLPVGLSLIVQGLVATPTAANGFFAITSGHRIAF